MSYVDVLLIEDDTVLGGALCQRLQLEKLSFRWAQSCAQAIELFRRLKLRPAFVLVDVRLPDGSGEQLFRQIMPHLAQSTVVFATAYGDIAQAVRAVNAGARDYLTKPYDANAVILRVRDAIARHGRPGSNGNIAVNPYAMSQATEHVSRQIELLAKADINILLQGETGVGKEVAARYIHAQSSHSNGPFVVLNCASLSEESVASQLFGHQRGAFSRSRGAYVGAFEEAADGTLFLDEVGELGARAQAMLLRVLEDRQYQPAGGDAKVAARCRFIASTNRDLAAGQANEGFRNDLFYRLAAGHIVLPPLRERLQDIVPLSDIFLQEACARDNQVEPLSFSCDAHRALLGYHWPGNVRELRNRISRAAVLADGPVIEAGQLFSDLQSEPAQAFDLAAARGTAETLSIQRAIAESGGQLNLAAKRLGISRTTLWKKRRAEKERK